MTAVKKPCRRKWAIGNSVYHVKFGDGVIAGFAREGQLAIVDFERVGTKRVCIEYLETSRPTAQIIPFPASRIIRRNPDTVEPRGDVA
jgi:hypothetical protein